MRNNKYFALEEGEQQNFVTVTADFYRGLVEREKKKHIRRNVNFCVEFGRTFIRLNVKLIVGLLDFSTTFQIFLSLVI